MPNVLLIHPPFCTPSTPSYAITYLYSFLKNNSATDIQVLDLNLIFHKLKFPDFFEFIKAKPALDSFENKSCKYMEDFSSCYGENNRKVLRDEKIDYFDELLAEIIKMNPKTAAFSLVYSSQVFYTYALIIALKKKGIKTIIGGSAVTEKIKSIADVVLSNEVELLEYVKKNGAKLENNNIDHAKLNTARVLDYTIWPLGEYLVSDPVISLRTSSSCFYQQCSFCTHHEGKKYVEYEVGDIRKSIIKSGANKVFFIDDMISTKRLLLLAQMLTPLKVSWFAQLRPMADLNLTVLKTLADAGLKMVIWGVESGSDRILNLMKKGTNKEDAALVLSNSRQVGISNVLYIMFGFPTETKGEFIETINFLKDNSKNIDLISTSIFGLQEQAPMFNSLMEFSIDGVKETKRTLLEKKISYTVTSGISQDEAKKLRKSYGKTLSKINKYPKSLNFFREEMLCILGRKD
jgi:radical SAM superfamily enzyme YgiQ (UPF0313 family)